MSAELTVVRRQPRRARLSRVGLYVFLTSMALLWLVPVVGAIYASLRPYSETQKLGIFSVAKTFTFQNYRNAWSQGSMSRAFGNTMFIVIPSLFLILFLSSAMAFAVSRFSWRFNVTLLLIFTAGELATLRRDTQLQAAIDGVSVRDSLLTPAAHAWFKQRGLLTFSWVVNDEQRMNQLVAADIDGLITDRLDIMGLLGRGLAGVRR